MHSSTWTRRSSASRCPTCRARTVLCCSMQWCRASRASSRRSAPLPAFEEHQKQPSMTATIEIRAPSEQTEGTRSQVQRWLKSVGDSVVENEPLIASETDKVTIEIPAPAGGVLAEILKQEQDEIAPGELPGRIQAGAESSVGVKAVAAPAPEVAQTGVVDDVTTAALTAHAA